MSGINILLPFGYHDFGFEFGEASFRTTQPSSNDHTLEHSFAFTSMDLEQSELHWKLNFLTWRRDQPTRGDNDGMEGTLGVDDYYSSPSELASTDTKYTDEEDAGDVQDPEPIEMPEPYADINVETYDFSDAGRFEDFLVTEIAKEVGVIDEDINEKIQLANYSRKAGRIALAITAAIAAVTVKTGLDSQVYTQFTHDGAGDSLSHESVISLIGAMGVILGSYIGGMLLNSSKNNRNNVAAELEPKKTRLNNISEQIKQTGISVA